ncbi:hypothetical protein NEIMUCOT_05397 [Neisseria mucosa ATCC 25996]|uniref:Uncharacterized protein n=1 Tax=Neisseria mucosa (strain ATCC 25996 / DSM 4631 / NCTC 10774 / M26) TaxID=546266 RepID=D2ZXP3_NEIM2|nr:hypothetical protein NEIMUCOT_05397 [Neisseria mucosa ATCC 25996]
MQTGYWSVYSRAWDSNTVFPPALAQGVRSSERGWGGFSDDFVCCGGYCLRAGIYFDCRIGCWETGWKSTFVRYFRHFLVNIRNCVYYLKIKIICICFIIGL